MVLSEQCYLEFYVYYSGIIRKGEINLEKIVVGAASAYKELYFFNPEFEGLPKEVQQEIQIICVTVANAIHGVFTMGFHENGNVYIETQGDELDASYDDIGAELEVKRVFKENEELIKALHVWFATIYLGE